MRRLIAHTVLLLVLPGGLAAQDLAHRVAGLKEANLRLSFAARPGVCGNGDKGVGIMDDEDSEDWVGECERGPVRVSLRVRSGRVIRASTHVGGHWRVPTAATTDLGTLPGRCGCDPWPRFYRSRHHRRSRGPQACDLCAHSTAGSGRGAGADQHRSDQSACELRKTALFWLGQSEDPRAIALFEEILRQ